MPSTRNDRRCCWWARTRRGLTLLRGGRSPGRAAVGRLREGHRMTTHRWADIKRRGRTAAAARRPFARRPRLEERQVDVEPEVEIVRCQHPHHAPNAEGPLEHPPAAPRSRSRGSAGPLTTTTTNPWSGYRGGGERRRRAVAFQVYRYRRHVQYPGLRLWCLIARMRMRCSLIL